MKIRTDFGYLLARSHYALRAVLVAVILLSQMFHCRAGGAQTKNEAQLKDDIETSFGLVFAHGAVKNPDYRFKDNFTRGAEELGISFFMIALVNVAGRLSYAYFGEAPGSVEEMTRIGLIPYAPESNDQIEYFDQYIAYLGYNANSPVVSQGVYKSIKPVPITQANPELILAFRWQVLWWLTNYIGPGKTGSPGSGVLWFNNEGYTHNVQYGCPDALGVGIAPVPAFWTNPFTQKPVQVEDNWFSPSKGDISVLPGSEYIRLVDTSDISNLQDYYWWFAFTWHGVNASYGMAEERD